MRQSFDLHLHTNNSDGEFSVEELIKQVKDLGIEVFSITDHDSIESVNEIKKCNISGLKYIKGVEISSILGNKYKMHILGYDFDENNEYINQVVNYVKNARIKRFYELADNLADVYGIKLKSEDLDKMIKEVKIPGKSHLAKLLIEYGYVTSVSEAFLKYLNNLKTRTSNRIDAKIAIDAIKKAGGKTIWAHPKKVENEYNIDFEILIPELINLGLDGIEVYNSLHSLDDSKRYLKISEKYKLLTSGGSDYHGYNVKSNVRIGELYNSGEEYQINNSEISILRIGEKNMNNDIMNVEGVRDFFRDEINENLYPYIIQNNLLQYPDNEIYKKIRQFVRNVENLTSIYLNSQSENKNEITQKAINSLYEQLEEIKSEIGSKKKL